MIQRYNWYPSQVLSQDVFRSPKPNEQNQQAQQGQQSQEANKAKNTNKAITPTRDTMFQGRKL